MDTAPAHAQFLALLDEVDEASHALAEVLALLTETTEQARRELLAGSRVSSMLPTVQLGTVRRNVSERLTALNSALSRARGEGIRVMVDHEGMTLREVANVVGQSRQFVGRLYHHACDRMAEGG